MKDASRDEEEEDESMSEAGDDDEDEDDLTPAAAPVSGKPHRKQNPPRSIQSS